MEEPIRVVICDHSDVTLRGLVELLRRDRRFCIVGEVRLPNDHFRTNQWKADLIIIDPFIGGRIILDPDSLPRQTKILVYSDHFSVVDFWTLLQSGISGYLVKSQTSLSRLSSVATTIMNEAILGFDANLPILGQNSQGRLMTYVPFNNSTPLTQRESEVLDLLASGATDREIAQSMVIAVSTVESHIRNVLQLR